MSVCVLCGGNSGNLVSSKYGLAHNLCIARKNLGLPTPNLGTRCSVCNGVGRIPKSKACPVLDPDQEALDAWAPICKNCNGKGYTKN